MKNQHKVYVSYHEEDQHFQECFIDMFSDVYNVIASGPVKMGDFDETKYSSEQIRQYIRDKYLRDTTVTVVLVGANTWQSKSVDWEINASIRQTEYHTRSGLLGIKLPTYPLPPDKPYDPRTIPKRLYDNMKCGFSKFYIWNEEPYLVLSWIHYAHIRRTEVLPHIPRSPFRNNWSGVGLN